MLYPKLNKGIFEKNAKTRMRVPDAVKLHGNSMLRCIEEYGHLISHKIPEHHWYSVKYHIYIMNRFTDVMNQDKHKAGAIKSVNDPQIFELLSVVSYMEEWKRTVHPDNFVPESTYEDTVHTCLGLVLTARFYLKKWEEDGYPGETVETRRASTDDLENLFCKARGGNPNADAKATNHFVSGNISGAMNSLAGSKKRNCGQETSVAPNLLNSGKIKKRKLND